MIDNKDNEYLGSMTIEDMEQKLDGKAIDDIQQDLSDIKDAINRTTSLETELGVVGQLQGILDKIKSGIVSIADIQNLLKQANNLKDNIERDINRIQKFDSMSEKQKKDLDNILEKSNGFLDKLNNTDFDLTDEQREKLIRELERTREDVENKKVFLLPFIGDLKNRLEKIKDREIDMAGLIDKIQGVLGIDVENPTNKIEDPSKQKETRVAELERQLSILNTGLVELMDDWGKTPEVQNILANLQMINNTGNNINKESQAYNNEKINNSDKRMREVDQKTIELKRENSIKDISANNSKGMNKSQQINKSKDSRDM